MAGRWWLAALAGVGLAAFALRRTSRAASSPPALGDGTVKPYKLSEVAPVLPPSSKASAPGEEGPSGSTDYREWLKKLSADMIPALRAEYPDPSYLAPLVAAEAAAAGVDPQVIWGVMWRESKWTPVGVTKIEPKPGGLPSTALGVSQVTRTRWRSERDKIGGEPLQHWHLIYPAVAIRYTARSYARGQRENGPAIIDTAAGTRFAPWLGAWWAGSEGAGAKRKQGDIETKGPEFLRYLT